MRTAKLIKTVNIIDPDNGKEVRVLIFKENKIGGIFGIDADYIHHITEVTTDDESIVPSIYGSGSVVLLDS